MNKMKKNTQYYFFLIHRAEKIPSEWIIQKKPKQRHAMKCETQYHMPCLEHPFLYFFFLTWKSWKQQPACPYYLFLSQATYTLGGKKGALNLEI